jgi:cardiolipin synthase
MKHHLPNILTVLRIVLVPVFIYLVILPDFYARIGAILLFILASATDFIDGQLARRWQVTSEFGKFMDPLADKMLVISALFALLYLEHQVALWMVLVIIGRDFLITFMRWLAIRRGTSLRTSRLGKAKTTFQMSSIVLIMAIIAIRTHPQSAQIRHCFEQAKIEGFWSFMGQSFSEPNLLGILAVMPYILILLTTIFTIISGLRYVATNHHLFLPSPDHKSE